VEFKLAPSAVPGKINRIHGTEVGEVARALHAHVLRHAGIRFVRNARARRLTRDATGRVAEVAIDVPESVVMRAARGVVVASGGFVRSQALLQTFAPQWVDAIKMGGRDNTGDGLLMACALGAGLADMAYIEATLGASIDHYPDLSARPDDMPSLLFPIIRGAVLVNLRGDRFANESLNYKMLGALGARQPQGVAFQVFDRKVMDRSLPSPIPADYRGALARGLLRTADSIEGLAAALAVPAERLGATMARYNAHAANGVDPDFDRPIADYGASGGPCIDAPPYYAYPCAPALTTTYCGIRVDRRMRVRDVFGDAIPGLYAAGEVVGGFHGAAYLSGTALGKAAVFGRTAGRECARHDSSGTNS
jgi:fumarate reductase flavoprotein subunit